MENWSTETTLCIFGSEECVWTSKKDHSGGFSPWINKRTKPILIWNKHLLSPWSIPPTAVASIRFTREHVECVATLTRRSRTLFILTLVQFDFHFINFPLAFHCGAKERGNSFELKLLQQLEWCERRAHPWNNMHMHYHSLNSCS